MREIIEDYSQIHDDIKNGSKSHLSRQQRRLIDKKEKQIEKLQKQINDIQEGVNDD